jgi:E3 ubiquitin-protein ligase synoviolin
MLNIAAMYCYNIPAVLLQYSALYEMYVCLYLYQINVFFQVFLYVAFVTLMIKLFTLPLFALRPMYYTMRDFKKAFHDIVMSRRAIRNMNTLYPDATAEELAAADNVCIICR